MRMHEIRRRRIRAVGGFLAAAGMATFARTAPAQQVDVNPPLPDVLRWSGCPTERIRAPTLRLRAP
jgi:hypothetical protein